MFLNENAFVSTTSCLSSDTRTGIESTAGLTAFDHTPNVFPRLEFELTTDVEICAGQDAGRVN